MEIPTAKIISKDLHSSLEDAIKLKGEGWDLAKNIKKCMNDFDKWVADTGAALDRSDNKALVNRPMSPDLRESIATQLTSLATASERRKSTTPHQMNERSLISCSYECSFYYRTCL